MSNDKPNYAYNSGFFASSLSADILIMRMRQHGFVLKPSKLKELRESLEQVCIDIKREAEEGGRTANEDFKRY